MKYRLRSRATSHRCHCQWAMIATIAMQISKAAMFATDHMRHLAHV